MHTHIVIAELTLANRIAAMEPLRGQADASLTSAQAEIDRLARELP